MKKISSVICAVFSLAAFMTSCTNLDEKVFSSVTEETYQYSVADFGPNVIGGYSPLSWNYVGTYWQTQELTGCCISTPANSTGWDDGGIYKRLQFHNWNSELGQLNDLWNNYYSGVVLCNSALNKFETGMIPASSDAEMQSGIAELKALRAYYYWILLDNFGDVPIVVGISQDLPSKSTRKEVFDFAVSELKEAIPNLNETQGGVMYGRINKWAAKAILANLYLNAEVYTGTPMWNECISQCDDIINSGRCQLSDEFRDSFRAEGVESSKEVLFTVIYDYSRGKTGNYLFMNSWHSELQKKFKTNAAPNMAGGPKAIPQFIDTYDPRDSRIDDTWLRGQQYDADGNPLYCVYDRKGEPLIFTKELPDGYYTAENEGYRFNKMEVAEGSEWSCSTDIPLLRYADVLMMKAECLLRTGKSGAGELVTQVRRRAFRDNPEAASVSDDELKGNSSYYWGLVENYEITSRGNTEPIEFGRMFDERCWEFVWEGCTRRDMIRFGIFSNRTWLSHTPQGDFRTVFPIPQRAVDSNPNISQNSNYVN